MLALGKVVLKTLLFSIEQLPLAHAEEFAEKIIEISQSFGIDAQVIGKVKGKQAGDPRLTINSDKGIFTYN